MWSNTLCAKRRHQRRAVFALALALGLGTQSARSEGVEWLAFEGGFVAAFQSFGGNSQSGFLAYAPRWRSPSGLGFKPRFGATLLRAQSQELIWALDATGMVGWKWPDWPMELEVGGGAELWITTPNAVRPVATAQLNLEWERAVLGIWKRTFVGYRLLVIPEQLTHSILAGVGIEW